MERDLTGLDLSTVPLDVTLTRADASGNLISHSGKGYDGSPIYKLVIEHDSYLMINSNQVSVMN